MYVKIFAQIYDSSIAEDYLVRLVFEDFLILADKDGHVDMTVTAIARRTNVPLEIVSRAIEKLSQPDPDSRTPEQEGKRIALLDPHRSWGWKIVNYAQYRSMRDEEARKEYFREKKRDQRAQAKESVSDLSTSVLDSQRQSPNSTQAEAEAEGEVKNNAASVVVDEIYKAYPRHKSPRDAKKAILSALKRIAPKRDAAWMLEAVRRYAETRKGQDSQFTPYPATWFNGDRFDECLEAAPAAPVSTAIEPDSQPTFAHPSRVLDFRQKARIQ